jgi:hypothetical protein
MRSWSRGVFRHLATVPRPRDDPRTHASGVDADRVLLFGSGAAVGWGVLSHDMALGGSLARALSHLTGRGTDVDVVADSDLHAAGAIAALRLVDLSRYDAIVITLGLNEAVSLSSITSWRRDLDGLLAYIRHVSPAGTPTFVAGVHATTQITRGGIMVASIVARHRDALNRASALLSAHRSNVTYVGFEPPARAVDVGYRASVEYREAGIGLALTVAPALDAASGIAAEHRRSRATTTDLLARHAVIDGLDIVGRGDEQRFDRLTDFARRSFRTSRAAITIVDGDGFWTKSGYGVSFTNGRREDAICFTTVRNEDSLVIADASVDVRFSAVTGIIGPPAVRFYAGHRIEAPDGTPIGVLCVFDEMARDITNFDRALLRDLALLVQKEIWLGSLAAVTAGYTIERFPQLDPSTRERSIAPVGPSC